MKNDNQKVHDIESRVADEQYRQALRETTIGGNFVLGPGVGIDRARELRRELARVAVPPERARGWVITLCGPEATGPDKWLEDPDRTYAIVRWGNGGVQAEAEIDWRVGTVFALYGSFVEIEAVSPPRINSNVSPLSDLRAFIVPGECRLQGHLTRTRYFATVAAGAGAGFTVPRFAYKLVATQISTDVAPQYELRLRGWGPAGPGDFARVQVTATPNRNFSDVTQQQPVYLPANCTTVRYANLDAVNAHDRVQLMFFLNL